MTGQGARDGEHLLLAAREQAAAAVAQLGERREVAVGRVGVEPLAVPQPEVLGDAEPEEEPFSGTCAIPIRARPLIDVPARSRPPNAMLPAIGSTMPETARRVVVLPAPFAPSSATTSPSPTLRSSSRTTAASS